MRKVLFAIILLIFIFESQSKHKLFFHDAKIIAGGKYVNESEVKSPCPLNTKEHPCDRSFLIRIYLAKDVLKPYIHVKGTDLTNQKVFLEQVFNMCTLFSNPAIDLFLKSTVEKIKKNMNFDGDCPYKKGLYEIRSYPHSNGFMMNLFPVNVTFRFTTTVKVRSMKKMENALAYQQDLDLVEVDD